MRVPVILFDGTKLVMVTNIGNHPLRSVTFTFVN